MTKVGISGKRVKKYVSLISCADGEQFLPSRWNGTYMCSSENITYTYELEVLKNLNDIGVNGKLYEENNILTIRGSYAYAIRFLTLQSNDLVQRPIHGKNFTDVELDVYLRNSVFMEGYILFKTAAGNKYSCMTELRRNAGKSILSMMQF